MVYFCTSNNGNGAFDTGRSWIVTNKHFLTDLSGNSIDSESNAEFLKSLDKFLGLPITIFVNILFNVSVADFQHLIAIVMILPEL